MNNLPKYIASMNTNKEGQIILAQKSVFSFFHQGVPFMAQLSRAYYKGMDMGESQGYNVRLTCFIGFLPLSLYGGPDYRNKVLSLVYRSNYNNAIKFYINHHQMIIGTSYNPIAQADALNVHKLILATVNGYALMYPFVNLFLKYITPPGKISKRYEMTH